VVIACHAASATASWQVVLKAGPLCRLSTLGPLMISTIALYSSRPGRGILLILNSGGAVMLMRFSKSLSLPVGIGASFPKVLISSASWNVSSFSALVQECSLHHLCLQPCCHLLLLPHCFLPPYDHYRGRCSTVAVALLLVLPEVLVSQVPRPQSRMVPPPGESRAVAPAEAAHSLALIV
jgi:hypothetical protein